MNKAFVKEPEPEEPRCPACGAFGDAVARDTVIAQLGEQDARSIGGSPYYCGGAGCGVGYFDAWGAHVEARHLRRSIYPKDPGGPICACFDVAAETIRQDAEAGRKDGIRELLARVASDEARCGECSPTGKSCETEVRRLFLRHLSRS